VAQKETVGASESDVEGEDDLAETTFELGDALLPAGDDFW
jgi:hypothetical protein